MEANPTAYFFFTNATDYPEGISVCIKPIEPPLSTLIGRCVVGKLHFVTDKQGPLKRGHQTFMVTEPLHIMLNQGMGGPLTMQPKPAQNPEKA